MVVAGVLVGVKPHIIEDEELRFCTEIGSVGNAGGFEIRLGLLGNIAWAPFVFLLGDRIEHVTDQTDGLLFNEPVNEGRPRIGDDQHIALIDRFPPADTGTVKPEAFFKRGFFQLSHRDGKVLPLSWKVHEFEIDHCHAFILDKFEDTCNSSRCCGFGH